MNQKQIDAIRKKQETLRQKKVDAKKQINALEDEVRFELEHCDHRLPNGQSASIIGPVIALCSICGKHLSYDGA